MVLMSSGYSQDIAQSPRVQYELVLFVVTMVCYAGLLCWPNAFNMKAKRQSSMKERTLQWLSAKIWSLKGSGLRGMKRTDSHLARRASRPLIGSSSSVPSAPACASEVESVVSSDYWYWLVCFVCQFWAFWYSHIGYEIRAIVFAITVYCVLEMATQSSSKKRKQSKKERTFRWLADTIWSLKGAGVRGMKRSTSTPSRLARRGSRPLIGTGSILPAATETTEFTIPTKGGEYGGMCRQISQDSTSAGSDALSPSSTPPDSPLQDTRAI
jgi:hypothetical protein